MVSKRDAIERLGVADGVVVGLASVGVAVRVKDGDVEGTSVRAAVVVDADGRIVGILVIVCALGSEVTVAGSPVVGLGAVVLSDADVGAKDGLAEGACVLAGKALLYLWTTSRVSPTLQKSTTSRLITS